MNKQNNAGYRTPLAGDKGLDYNTFLMMFRHAIASGDMNLVTTDITAADQPLMAIAIIERRTQQAGESGTIPDDTEVVMYKATEAKWDSSVNEYVAVTEGMEFDGIDQNFLRLMGQPGFSNAPYNYDPLLSGAIVPIYRVPENAGYDSPGDVAANIKVFDWSWQIIYLGEDSIVHPFKASKEFDMAGDGMTIIVGAMRAFDSNAGDGTDSATTSHTGADLITIHQGSTAPKILLLDTPDSLVLENQAGDSVIIYYEIDLSSIEPTAELKDTLSNEWPPTDISEWENKLIVPVCYARIVETMVGEPFIETIGQTLFDHITFDGSGGGGGIAVRRSIQLIGQIVQFLNDIKIGNLGGAKALGYLYGGQDVLQDLARQYFPMWDDGSVQQSYLNPSSIPSTGGPGEELNKGEIRMNDLFNHTTEVFHGHFEEDSRINTETIQEVFLETVDPGGSTIKCRITKNMHIYPPGSHPGNPYENERITNLSFDDLGAIGSSGSLFDTDVDQETRTVDDLGANIDTQNTPINQFQYSAINNAGDPIEINVAGAGNHSIKPAIDRDITTYAAPKSGNEENILLNLARFGFNTTISVIVTYINAPFTQASRVIDGENNMTSTLVFDAEPTDSVEFFITLEFLKALGAYTRLDALGEYAVDFVFTYLSDGADVDIDGAGNNTITVNDSQFVLGTAIATTTPTIPGIRSSDSIVCQPILRWFNNADAQPAMFGETNYDLVNAVSTIGGAADYTHSVAAGSINTPVVNHSSVNTGGVLAVPISFEYEILKAAAATTDYSGDDTALTLDIIRVGDNTPLDISISVPPGGGGGGFGDIFQEDIINPTDSNATDGLLFQLIAFLSENDIVQGADYKIRINTPGLLPAPVEFTFNLAETGIMFWSDSFGSSSQDRIFEMSDDFSGIGTNSNQVGDDNWNWRWAQQQGIQSDGNIGGSPRILTVTLSSTPWQVFTVRMRFWGAFQVNCGAYTRVEPTDFVWQVDGNQFEVEIKSAGGDMTIRFGGSSQAQGGGFSTGNSLWLRRDGSDAQQVYRNGVTQGFSVVQAAVRSRFQFSIERTGGSATTEGVVFKHTTYEGSLVEYIVPWPERWKMDESNGRDYIIEGETALVLEVDDTGSVATSHLALDLNGDEDPDITIGYREDGLGGVDLVGGFGFAGGRFATEFFAIPMSLPSEAILELNDFTFSDLGGSVGFASQKSIGLEGTGIFDSRWTRTNVLNDPDSETLTSDIITVHVTDAASENQGINYNNNFVDFDADFEVSMDVTVGGLSTSSPTIPRGIGNQILINIDGLVHQFGWVQNSNINGLGYFDGSWHEIINMQDGGSWNFKVSRVGTTVTFTITGDDSPTPATFTKSGTVSAAAWSADNTGGGGGTPTEADLTATNFIFNVDGSELTEKRVLFKEVPISGPEALIAARDLADIGMGGNPVEHSWLSLIVGSSFVRDTNLFRDNGSGPIGAATWRFTVKYEDDNFNLVDATRWVKIEEAAIEAPVGTPYTTS